MAEERGAGPAGKSHGRGAAAPRHDPGRDPGHDHSHHHHHHDHSGCAHDHGASAPRPFDEQALVSARAIGVSRGGRWLLQDIDIDIRPREIVTVIGPNGAGKTTLVRVLLGVLRPDEGRLEVRSGTRIGYVPQRFDIDRALPMTVERFLTLGQAADKGQIAAALAEVGASKVSGRQLADLSGGEFQRVVLARALLREPTLLILDEPVRGVDYVGEAELYTLIARLRDSRGLGVLLVSHDLHVVMANSDRVVCINGHVCCSGVPETVAQHPEYVRLFGADTARAFGLYHHHHDHTHDLAGAAKPDPPAQGGGTP